MQATRPKLAYVIGTLNPGGTERLVLQMSRALADRFDVSVFCLDEPGAWASQFRQRNVPVYCLWRQPGLDISVALKLARAFRRLRVEIVHAHQCTPWFYAALSRLFHRAPRLVLQEHGRFYPEVEKPLRRLVNRLLIRRLTHRFVAVSRDIRDRLVRYEGLDRQSIEVIYNGIAPVTRIGDAERARLRTELGMDAGDFVVGTAGRIDPIKNLPMFVDALAEASAHADGVRGLIIGDGPAAGEIERRIRQRGIGDGIRMTGYRDDVGSCMQCMDLFVLSSFSEGISLALLEAMSAGVPVVVTAVGGNPEVVEDGKTGWVIPSESVESLAARIGEAAAARDAAKSLGSEGRLRIEQTFAFNRMLEGYEAVYDGLLQGCISAEARVQASQNR